MITDVRPMVTSMTHSAESAPPSSLSGSPSPPDRRIASWSSRVRATASSSPWVGEDKHMTPLPSPGHPPPGQYGTRDWGSFPVKATLPNQVSPGSADNVANRGRSSSVFEELRPAIPPPPLVSPTLSNGSVSGRSKNHSFFDLDLTAGDSTGSPTPPVNPPSRGNSLRKAAGESIPGSPAGGSWLDRLDKSNQSSWRYGTLPRAGVIDGLPPASAVSTDELLPGQVSKSGASEFGQMVGLGQAGPDNHKQDTSPSKPALPALQTNGLRARNRLLSTSTPSSRPMTALPTPIDDERGKDDDRGKNIRCPPPHIDLPTSTLAPGQDRTSPLTPSMDDPPPLRLSLEESVPSRGDMIGEYRIERLLGNGAFSRVALARSTDSVTQSGLVALKLITVKSYDGNERMRVSVVREIDVLRNIRHPSLVTLLASFSTQLYTVLVLDYAPGGELFDFLGEWHAQVEEPLARRIFGELCDAVGWMHSIGLVHRDIKLENILLTSRPFPATSSASVLASLPTPFVKLTDFGLSRFISPSDPTLTTRCGSEAYAAPELIMGKKYDGRQTDAWALGVVLYAIVTGVMPFVEAQEPKGRRSYLLKIAKGEYKWAAGRLVTEDVQRLVGRLLVREPAKRARVQDIWDDEWMLGEGRAVRVEGSMVQGDTLDAWSRRGSQAGEAGL